jgi:hypothetical protein
MMEAICAPETSVLLRAIRHHVPEDAAVNTSNITLCHFDIKIYSISMFVYAYIIIIIIIIIVKVKSKTISVTSRGGQ